MNIAADAMNLHNDTVVNVVALLKEPVGSTRLYPLKVDQFSLDDDLAAVDVAGTVKLTRLSDEIIASIRARGVVTLECQRCLRLYEQPFAADFSEEFRESVDLKTGIGVATDSEDDERFAINENHELDFAEALRQEILVALPMRPACGEGCPGPDVVESGDDDEGDDRFAALAKLLDDDSSS